MTITIAAPELEASLTKAAAASNATVDEYVSQILRRAVASEGWESLQDEPSVRSSERGPTGYGKVCPYSNIQRRVCSAQGRGKSQGGSAKLDCVLDACAMIADLRGEPARFASGSRCLAHAVNACEVYYDFLRASDATAARKAIESLLQDGLIICEDMDTAFWQSVGDLKVTPGQLSLADCFGFALAAREGVEFLTSEHYEFDRIVPLGIAPITFIR